MNWIRSFNGVGMTEMPSAPGIEAAEKGGLTKIEPKANCRFRGESRGQRGLCVRGV